HVPSADIFSPRPDQFVVGVLLQDVTCPTTNAANCKNRCVKIQWDSHHVVKRSRVEVDVRIQSLLTHDHLLDLARHLVPLSIAASFTNLFREASQVSSARVFCFVHSMAESHDF